MVVEVLFAGAFLGKAVGELVDAVKAAGKKISSFQTVFRKIESTLETITPRLKEITDLDEKLNQSGVAVNDLVALVLKGKELVDKCSKVDRFNFLKVRKYHKLLDDFESHLSKFFSTNLQLDQSKDAREALLLLKEIKNYVQALVVETENDEAEGSTSRERRDHQGNDLEIIKEIEDEAEAEGPTSRERRDHQGNDLEIPIKLGHETSSSSGIVPQRQEVETYSFNTNETSSSSVPVEENIVSICARDLAIEWIENSRYWKWSSALTQDNCVDEVAELLQVWFLHVCGYFGTETLQHGTEYKVVFYVMLIDSASGWEVPVKLKLILPDGSVQQREERFKLKPRNQWLQITVGNFTMSPSTVGTVEFLLEEVTLKTAKKGILIKGAVINKVL